jgi:hypothetical protein
MAVYVGPARWPHRDQRWAHLTADTKEELLAFARQLGLRDGWRQRWDGKHWHFDIPEPVREQAIALGAIGKTDRELVTIALRRAPQLD